MNHHVFIAEEAITQAMIDDTLPHPRLHAAVQGLDQGACSVPLTELRQAMAHRAGITAQEALIALLDDLRTHRRFLVADLQILAIGFYRMVWRLLARLDTTTNLDEIRRLDARQAAHLCYGFTFGMHLWPFPIPSTMTSRICRRLANFLQSPESDQEWKESGPLPLAAPLVAISDHHLTPAANAIRNTFFAHVFIDTLATEHEPPLGEDALVLDFLLNATDNPALIPFLRHVTPSQARFRLTQLAQALIALHQAESTSQTSASRDHPFIEGAIGCLLSPFVSLRGWLRANRERLLIPVIRHMPGDDLITLHRPAGARMRPEAAWITAAH